MRFKGKKQLKSETADAKTIEIVESKLAKVIRTTKDSLYEDDDIFLKNMVTNNLNDDDINRYRYWEWPQGVALLGFWKLYENTNDKRYFDIITNYYDQQFKIGLPSKNINTTAPMLTMAYLYEHTKDNKYKEICIEWANWLVEKLPKTEELGFQHLTSDTLNENELWVDTLFMAALFLAKMGMVLDCKKWVEAAKYQFLVHSKYLTERKSGLWYHGWTFNGNHNFTEALWGRGNCWITIAIPEFLSIVECEEAIKEYLGQSLKRQVDALEKYQDSSGMWHTIIDDAESYLEASATCGFGYGILKAVDIGIIDPKYKKCAYRAIEPILDCIDEDGYVNQVSYGTPMGRDSIQHYKDIEIKKMPYGQAIAILFLIEVLKDSTSTNNKP
ncbi:MAG: glycoside hydrolase family 105 protein [Clostridiaceae bacterium]|jgi:unsaturated rhamnogalacturonyl hydrolase|nr:glycoside hydrolase family 105 protein [Clostridiaceae bacterium]